MKLEPAERRYLAALIADDQLQLLRRLRDRKLETREVRKLRAELALAGVCQLKVSHVPPKT